MFPISCLQLIHAHFSSIFVTSYFMLVGLECFIKIDLSTSGRSHCFYWGKYFFSDLVLHDISLHIQYNFVEILVHDQLNPDVLRDIRHDEAYDAFDSEVRHEYLSLGNSDIYCVAKKI